MPTLTHADLRLNYQLIGPDLTPARPPVSMIHGLGANLAFWYLGALRHLGRDKTILLHDLRGHGASSMPPTGYRLTDMVEDFRRLLDSLRIPRTHLVGHSHGARVALLFALTYPERVESLTLADTQLRALQPPMKLGEWPHWQDWKADLMARGVTSFPPEDSLIDFKLLAELGPRSAGGKGGRSVVDAPPGGIKGRIGLAGGARGGIGGGMANGLGGGGAGGAETPRSRRRGRRELAASLGSPGFGPLGPTMGANNDAGLGQTPAPAGSQSAIQIGAPRRIDLQSRQMGARGAEQWDCLMHTTRAPEEMHDESAIHVSQMYRLTMPVLLIYGALSHCVPTADRLAEVLPNARRILVPGAGHFFPIVKPRPFARALTVFLDSLASAQGRATMVRKPARKPRGTPGSGPASVSYFPKAVNRLTHARRLMPGLAARAVQLVRRAR
jgi:pimeloyl-ACP methyl ester carboxylesterase